MINKIVQSVAEALAGVKDGATVLIGGFGSVGQPDVLIEGLIEQGASNLVAVLNNAGIGRVGVARLMELGRVRKIICSFPRSSDPVVFETLYREGRIELEIVPQGTLAERIRAAGAGIPAFFTATAAGTLLARGKETPGVQRQALCHGTGAEGRRGAGGGLGGRPLGQPRLPGLGRQLQPGHGHGAPTSPSPRCSTSASSASCIRT